MGYNVPVVTQDNFSFGPGILYAGECGECPVTDIGAVRSGAELVITREKITVEQGSPYQRICDYVIRETVVLTVTGIEWNFDNLARALGAGIVSSGAGYQRLRFGGAMGVCQSSLCFGDDIHEFPYGFTAIQPDPLQAWALDLHDAGGVLGDEEHLFEIYRETT